MESIVLQGSWGGSRDLEGNKHSGKAEPGEYSQSVAQNPF